MLHKSDTELLLSNQMCSRANKHCDPKHSCGSSPFKIKEWVTLEWPMQHLVKTTSSHRSSRQLCLCSSPFMEGRSFCGVCYSAVHPIQIVFGSLMYFWMVGLRSESAKWHCFKGAATARVAAWSTLLFPGISTWLITQQRWMLNFAIEREFSLMRT